MDLHHQFEVAAGVEDTWPAFLDMPRMAPCLPGAEVTEVIDDRNIRGMATVKVGPVNLRFSGRAEITRVDEAGRSAVLTASGSDAKGRGNADADVHFSLRAAGAGRTLVEVTTTLKLTGSVAQYGRASGLVDEIANQLIAEFVRNLEAELAGGTIGPPDAEHGAGPAMPATTQPAATRPVSGLRVLFRALVALIKKWLRRS
jgi:carbon monoxide dehydrogenase subunit G